MQLSQTQHPASAVPSHRGSRVHRGFLASWQANGLSDRVSEHVRELLDTAGDRRHVRVLTCGHSLGGAIASLAALDFAQRCDIEPAQLSCYTFGCPRTGNHAFAALHAKWVPDTWCAAAAVHTAHPACWHGPGDMVRLYVGTMHLNDSHDTHIYRRQNLSRCALQARHQRPGHCHAPVEAAAVLQAPRQSRHHQRERRPCRAAELSGVLAAAGVPRCFDEAFGL